MYSVIKKTISLSFVIMMLVTAEPTLGKSDPNKSPKQESLVTSPEKSTKSAPQTLSEPKANEQTCTKLYQKFVPALQDLWKKRGPELRAEDTSGYALIEDSPIEYCKDDSTRQDLISLLSKILNVHSGKIGVILPLANHSYLQHVMTGFQARLKAANLEPKKTLVIIDNQGKDDRTHQAIASLIFEHRVTAIIGGTEPNDAAILRSWAPRLMIPTFIMSEPPQTSAIPFVYYSHPTQKALAEAAAEANIRFGHRRISILSPADQHSDRFIAAYISSAKRLGLTIIHQVPYDSKRFELMEAAARKIFRLDPADRQEDLRKLYETAKKHAQQTGEPFNPKMVALQPDIQQDAVLIPDNFKIVRHFAKIFGYLGVRRMPLFGHIEWRSQGLVSPWDSFLNGAYFVDFQGAYTNFPGPIALPTTDSPYFIAPDKVEQADFTLLGWRTMETPLALTRKRNDMRRKLDAAIPRKADNKDDVIFDRDNTIVWTPSLFTVISRGKGIGSINLLGQ